jgi:hypothetical protein
MLLMAMLAYMTEVMTSVDLDNSTDHTMTYHGVTMTSEGSVLTSNPKSNYRGHIDYSLMFSIFGGLMITITALGTLANGGVLFVLLYDRETRGSTANVFICNQTALDLIACSAMLISSAMELGGVFDYMSGAGGWFLCYLFDSNAIAAVAINASKMSIVFITL